MFDEKEHISRILSGDLQAFGSLVKQYQQLVFYIINRLIKDDEDKKDVSQEVFIKVHKSLHNFKFQSKLSTWIASIAQRTTLNHLRDYTKNPELKYKKEMEGFQFTYPDPAMLSEKKEIKEYIRKLMEEMPVPYKTVLTLYHLNEFSYEEIAQITNMPEGTVKNYLFRARKLLKDKLKPYIND